MRAIYFTQTGAVYGGRFFDIQRGIKQGDTLSPMLFNAVLECAFREWKGKCGHSWHNGWQISVTHMIWSCTPVPSLLCWRWLKPCHANYSKLAYNQMQPKAKYSQQNRWITQRMLKCRMVWCMFLVESLHTSVLADTSLGTRNNVAVWNDSIAWQALGQNSANTGF